MMILSRPAFNAARMVSSIKVAPLMVRQRITATSRFGNTVGQLEPAGINPYWSFRAFTM
jgi:hypothetical protein